ncbi:hypothetical protein DL93DRAFT_1580807 [Clavulina sp. PMI_390]|nr:hypothetical protein DL93DRAFT_1580807 [Clavulina sp. PMI_390]
MSSSSDSSRRSAPPTWRVSKRRSQPVVASVSQVFGAPVNSTSTVSAISTLGLPGSPLRNEIVVATPTSDTASTMSVKRERDAAEDARVSDSDTTSVQITVDDDDGLTTPKRQRLDDPEPIPIPGPSRRPSTLSLKGRATEPAVSVHPIPSPRPTTWFGTIYKSSNRSSVSAIQPSNDQAQPVLSSSPPNAGYIIHEPPASVIDIDTTAAVVPAPPTTPSIIPQIETTLVPEPEPQEALAPNSHASSSSTMTTTPPSSTEPIPRAHDSASTSSSGSFVARWFGASPRTSYVSDEPSHTTDIPPQASSSSIITSTTATSMSSNPNTDITPTPSTLPLPSQISSTSTSTSAAVTEETTRAASSLLVAAAPSPDTPLVTPSTSLPLPPSKPLNPKGSRYSLRLPLLGASKQRLDEVLPIVVQEQHEGEVSSRVVSTTTTSEVVPTLATIAATVNTSAPEAESNTSILIPAIVETPPEPPAPLPPASAGYLPASWWSYLGLASSTPLPASPKVAPSLASTSNPNADVPEAPLDAAPEPMDVDPPLATASEPEPTPSVLAKLEAETSTSARAAPSWIASWIGWGVAETEAPASVPSSSSEAEAGPYTGGETLTEAEQVKAEALARDAAAVPVVEEPPTPTVDPSPLLTAETRASWVSFFSSRPVASMKLIKDGSAGAAGNAVTTSGGEMEVMDLDEDEPPTAADSANQESSNRSAAPTPAPSTPKLKPTTSVKGAGSGAVSVASRSPSPTKRSNALKALPAPPPSTPPTPSTPNKKINGDSEDERSSLAPSPAPPLTNSKDAKRKSTTNNGSSTTSKKDPSNPKPPKVPNLLLPTWGDTFYAAPRSLPPPSALPAPPRSSVSTIRRGFQAMTRLISAPPVPPASPSTSTPNANTNNVIEEEMAEYQRERKERLVKSLEDIPIRITRPPSPTAYLNRNVAAAAAKAVTAGGEEKKPGVNGGGGDATITPLVYEEEQRRMMQFVGTELPRAWSVLGQGVHGHSGSGSGNSGLDMEKMKKVAIIGVHGWFPGAFMRAMIGEPTGTSKKFAEMMETSILDYAKKHNLNLDSVTKIPLEGEGSIELRVNKLYESLLKNEGWVMALHEADAIFVATHSQGCPVSTLLLDRLIQDGHIVTSIPSAAAPTSPALPPAPSSPNVSRTSPQKLCLLGMCGVHHGPLSWLNNSTLVTPYFQYIENAAARELFEFQDSNSAVSKLYMGALKRVLDHDVKFVYVASLNDQVVPIYSASFVAASHPLILRALYIDGDAYSNTDFLSNLLVLLLRIRNAGLDDGGLLAHLSEATAGSLSGVGHSTTYEEPATYNLAIRFLFEASGSSHPTELHLSGFSARNPRNDYTIPWALRGLIEDRRISSLFGQELAELRVAFDKWQPKTAILKEVRKKLEPVRQPPPTIVQDQQDGETRSLGSKL